MQSGTSSGQSGRLGRDVVKGKTNRPRLLRVIWRRGSPQNWGFTRVTSNRWFCSVGCWEPKIGNLGFFSREFESPVVQFLYQELLDSSFMILPSLPMGTPSPPRVVGFKPPPKTWHFTFFDHQEGGISARLQDLVDYIITGDFRGLPSSGDGWYMFWMLKI